MKRLEAKMMKEEQFEEQERRSFLLIVLMGRVPPGIRNIFKWSKLIPYMYAWSAFLWIIGCSYLLPTTYYLLTEELPSKLLSQLIRRWVLYLYGVSSVAAQILKMKRLNSLYADWNEIINDGFYRTERQKILLDRMKRTKKYIKYSAFGTVLVPQLYNVVTFANKNSSFAALSGYPHDTNSPYHYWYLVLGTFHYFTSATRLACDMLRLYLLTMLAAQIQFLRQTLAAIFEEAYVDSAGQGSKIQNEIYIKKLRVSLKTWLRAHQNTLRWYGGIKDYMGLECSLAYMGAANYMILYVFYVPTFLNGQIQLLLLATLYGSFTMILVFYEARLADEIEDNSQRMFDEAFVKNWYLLPIDIQKSLKLISYHTKERPIFFKAFGIYKDSSETFLKIMMLSYRCLMFLIQVYE